MAEHFLLAVPGDVGERAVDGDDVAVEVGQDDAFARALEDARGLAQPRLRRPALLAQAFGLERAPYRRPQPGGAVFERVIRRALLQGVDRGLFADAAGDDHERDVEPALAQQGEGARAAELRQVPVGQDEVRHRRQGLEVVGLGLDAGPVEGQALLFEPGHHQLGVARDVLDHQGAQHARPLVSAWGVDSGRARHK